MKVSCNNPWSESMKSMLCFPLAATSALPYNVQDCRFKMCRSAAQFTSVFVAGCHAQIHFVET